MSGTPDILRGVRDLQLHEIEVSMPLRKKQRKQADSATFSAGREIRKTGPNCPLQQGAVGLC